ncbi:MAG: SDR family oxidoreductase [Bacillota bacterium]|nr:SDR family oxidoreductase [Bacillota bacterium]MDW7678438.1 SDR family oxidoreductase [Bacillota bacterium]
MSAGILENPATRENISSYHPLQRLGTPRDIAALTVFLLSSEASWITGQVMGVDGGRSVIL